MIGNLLPREAAAIVATIDPDAYAHGAQTSDWVDMAAFECAMFALLIGDVDTSTSVAFKLQEATSSAGAGNTDISGKAITTLTSTSPNTVSNSQAIINIRAEELTINSSFRYVAAVVTTADTASPVDSPTTTSDYGLIGLGFNPRHGPADDFDLASVGEIVD